MDKTSKILFSLVAGKDLLFSAVRGSGAGGQKRNKTCSCVILDHPDSGVRMRVEDERSQHQNKRQALHRLAEHPKFRAWVRVHAAAILAGFRSVEEKVDRWLHPEHLRVEELITYVCDGPGCQRTEQVIANWRGAQAPSGWTTIGDDRHICAACSRRSTPCKKNGLPHDDPT